MSVYPVDGYGLYTGPPIVTPTTDVSGFTSAEIRALSNRQVAALTTAQVAAIATDALAGLSARQVKALSTKVSALTTRRVLGAG